MKALDPKQALAILSLGTFLGAGCNDGIRDQGGGGGGGGAPALTAADMPGVSPCPNQAILTDAALFTDFRTALLNGTFLYLDVPFDAGDLDIFKKKCGLDAFWNPADNVDEVAPLSVPVTVSDLFLNGNAGICATGFDNGSFGTGEGLPAAGTYRKEFKVAHLGTTYHVRTRVSVIGASAGAKFADLGILVPDDLENTLGYEVDGNAVPHANVLTAIAGALQSPDATVVLDVYDTPGGTLLLSALIEVLCVEIL